MNLIPLKPVNKLNLKKLARPSSPNTFLLCPRDFSISAPDHEAPVFPVTAGSITEIWDKIAKTFPRTEKLSYLDDIMQRNYVQRTPLMRYPDIITIEFIINNNKESSIAIYSRSQYGYSDLGTNRRRVLSWTGKLLSELN